MVLGARDVSGPSSRIDQPSCIERSRWYSCQLEPAPESHVHLLQHLDGLTQVRRGPLARVPLLQQDPEAQMTKRGEWSHL